MIKIPKGILYIFTFYFQHPHLPALSQHSLGPFWLASATVFPQYMYTHKRVVNLITVSPSICRMLYKGGSVSLRPFSRWRTGGTGSETICNWHIYYQSQKKTPGLLPVPQDVCCSSLHFSLTSLLQPAVTVCHLTLKFKSRKASYQFQYILTTSTEGRGLRSVAHSNINLVLVVNVTHYIDLQLAKILPFKGKREQQGFKGDLNHLIKVTLQVTIKDHIYGTNKLNWRPKLIQSNTMKLSKTNNYKVISIIHRKPETILSVNLKDYF